MGTGQGGAQLRQSVGVELVDQGDIGLRMQASHQHRREFLVQHNLLFHRRCLYQIKGGLGGSRSPSDAPGRWRRA
ncbi:hypothetical protein D3C73_1493220 [compost metagenome]